jgi:hypothetical protein
MHETATPVIRAYLAKYRPRLWATLSMIIPAIRHQCELPTPMGPIMRPIRARIPLFLGSVDVDLSNGLEIERKSDESDGFFESLL